MKKNILERAIKTAVEAFCGTLVPEVCIILNNGFPESWNALWLAVAPVLSAAIGAGISAAWNYIEGKLKEEEK